MQYRLFDLPDLPADEPEPKLSYGRRLTIRNEGLIAQGYNPASRRQLLRGADPDCQLRCKDCKHAWRMYGWTGSFFKCAKNPRGVTRSIATDIRWKWPACVLFEPREDTNQRTAVRSEEP